MLYANTDSQHKVTASPGVKGVCPHCGGDVIAKCGSIKTWHWSHKKNDCDAWAETMTQWHIDWQNVFPMDCQEISMGQHRADVFWNSCTWEFQYSYINSEDVQDRERFYGNYGSMLWVFYAAKWELYQLKTILKDYRYRIRPDVLDALRQKLPGWGKRLIISTFFGSELPTNSKASDNYELLPLLDNNSLLLPSYIWQNFNKPLAEIQIGNLKITLPTIKTWFKLNWTKPTLLNCKNQMIIDLSKGNYWHTESTKKKIKKSDSIENSLLFVIERVEKKAFYIEEDLKEYGYRQRVVEGTIIIGFLLEKRTFIEKLTSLIEDKNKE